MTWEMLIKLHERQSNLKHCICKLLTTSKNTLTGKIHGGNAQRNLVQLLGGGDMAGVLNLL